MPERIARPPIRLPGGLPDGHHNGTVEVAKHFLDLEPDALDDPRRDKPEAPACIAGVASAGDRLFRGSYGRSARPGCSARGVACGCYAVPGLMTGLAFLDTETVTLDPGEDVIWEIGLILRDPPSGHEHQWRWQVRPNMDKAHPKALEVSQFDDRFAVPDGADAVGWGPVSTGEPAEMTLESVATVLGLLLDGRHVVGAVPNFDTERLALFMRRWTPARTTPWHYHLCDVENLVAGRYGLQPPWDSEALSRRVGVKPERYQRHTALGDATWARDIYDAVMERGAGDSTMVRAG